MGSRGTFSPSFGKTGGIPSDKRNYSTVGVLGRIKIIQCNIAKNNPTMTYSNTKSTTYYAFSKEKQEITSILYYRNHKLIKSVDLSHGAPHVHYWNSKVVGRKSHDKRNTHSLNDRDKRLAKQALNYNKDLKNGEKNN